MTYRQAPAPEATIFFGIQWWEAHSVFEHLTVVGVDNCISMCNKFSYVPPGFILDDVRD